MLRFRYVGVALAAAALAGSGVAAAGALGSSGSTGDVPAADLPSRSLTPGATFGMNRLEICWPGYSASVRKVPSRERAQVYARYHLQPDPYAYEVDRLISLELGGSNSIKNLWPEPYAGVWGARAKDKLESKLHALVCSGYLTLAAARRAIKVNWVAAYQLYVANGGSKLISTRPDVVDPTTASTDTTSTTTSV
jgi:hypothetical protein